MCLGGGQSAPPPATIVMPDMDAYDDQLDERIAMMTSQQEMQSQLAQMELNAALRRQQDVLKQLAEYREEEADEVTEVEAEARRQFTIVGPPPPEETASAPVVGRDREKASKKKKGKQSLRINRRNAGASSGTGTGLNIT